MERAAEMERVPSTTSKIEAGANDVAADLFGRGAAEERTVGITEAALSACILDRRLVVI
jgi:hypothetical protein